MTVKASIFSRRLFDGDLETGRSAVVAAPAGAQMFALDLGDDSRPDGVAVAPMLCALPLRAWRSLPSARHLSDGSRLDHPPLTQPPLDQPLHAAASGPRPAAGFSAAASDLNPIYQTQRLTGTHPSPVSLHQET